MKKASLLLVLLLSWASALPAKDIWTSYTDLNGIHALSAQGNYIWCAALGGAVRLDRRDGSMAVYRAQDGLADNNVQAVAAVQNGVAWFGTPKGLSTFDGIAWKTYTNTNGLTENDVIGLDRDSDNSVWILDKGSHSIRMNYWITYALQKFDGKILNTVYSANNYSSFGHFLTIRRDDIHDMIWLGSDSGILSINLKDNSRESYNYGEDRNISRASRDIAVERNGMVWFVTDSTLYSFDMTAWNKFTPFNSGLPGNPYSVAVDQNSIKWIGTDKGLARFDGTNWAVYTMSTDPEKQWIKALTVDDEGNIWGAAADGIVRFDGKAFKLYAIQAMLPGNDVSVIAVDQNNVKWFGSKSQPMGAVCFDGKIWKRYTKEDGLGDDRITAIAIDHNGVKWFGSEQGGLSKFDGSTWKTYTKESGVLPDNYVSKLGVDKDNVLWAAVSNIAMMSFDGQAWKSYPPLNWFVENFLYDTNNNLYAYTEKSLWKLNGAEWQQELKSQWGYSLFFSIDHNNAIWSAGNTEEGKFEIASLTPGIGLNYISPIPDPLSRSGYTILMTMVEDKNYLKWFSFTGQGINGAASYNGSTWTVYSKEASGLTDNNVQAIAVDKDNIKWFGTKGGLSSLNDQEPDSFIKVLAPNGGEQWADGTVQTIKWTAKGVQSVRIEYSPDGGSTYKSLADNINSSLGSYQWLVFEPDSNRYLIKITDTSSPGLTDTSDNFFSILPGTFSTELGKWTYYPYPDWQEPNVTAFTVDHTNKFWIGFFNGDVICLENNIWHKYTSQEIGVGNWYITSIFVDKSNNKWVTSWMQNSGDNILARFDGTTWQLIKLLDPRLMIPVVTRVNNIIQDKDGLLWLAGNNAVVQLKPDLSWMVYNKTNSGIGFDKITSVTVDQNNVKWFGRGDVGRGLGDMVSFDGSNWKMWKDPKGFLSDDPVNHVTAGLDSLIGLDQGNIYFFKGDKKEKGYGANFTDDITCDKNGIFWNCSQYIYTYDSYGLPKLSLRIDRCDGTNIKSFFGNQSLFENIHYMAVDDNNVKWFASDKGIWSFEDAKTPLEVDKEPSPLPMVLSNYPNPFNSSTTLEFSLPAPGKVTLAIYNLAGQKIRELVSDTLHSGKHTALWDGKDEQGRPVSSGIYFPSLKMGEKVMVGRMLLLK